MIENATNDEHFFEGVEKLLEIWFVGNDDNPQADLRRVPRSTWDKLLKCVNCEIISSMQNDDIDAYVLSESSMFVSSRRWILKTCGTTTLLNCLKPLMTIAERLGLYEISDLFYSRKNFVRPELQKFPHRGFREEVEYLDTVFENGCSYCLGSLNRECWFLYTFSKTGNSGVCLLQSLNDLTRTPFEPDQTIEILMQDLDSDVMSIFSNVCSKSAKEATLKSGIDKILPEMKIDDYLFDPCGYSMNGIGDDGEYMTIHVTPESKFSFVSFESNISLSNYTELINRVVKTFRPRKFITTIFANKSSPTNTTIKEMELEFTKSADWHRKDMQYCRFPSYNLLYAQYVKHD